MNNDEIVALGQKYVMNTYGRLPIALVKGEGTKVWDADGKEYLDFVGGLAVNSLGHSHSRITRAVAEQAGKLMHCSNIYWIEPQVQLAQKLAELSCLDKVFFCNSGAEANEAAIKLARKYAKLKMGPDKYEIITMEKSFHGRTIATITATGQAKFQKGFEPLPAGFKYVPFNNLEALKQAIGPNTMGVMLEPIQGEGGVNEAHQEYLQGVRKLCDDLGLLLIFDEVQVGMGRTGKMFGYQLYGVEPDIMTLAKALGSGFPIGAMLSKEAVAVFEPGDHASTFGGNPLACAVALATIEVMNEENFLAHVEEMSRYFKGKLSELKEKYSFIKEVRGQGLILGMELTIEGKAITDATRQAGLLINCTNLNVLRFLPPLNVTKEEINMALAILDSVLASLRGC